ncbi:hypothetical protein [Pseudonocardia charpentierae]|uniref:Uncharacterized protein n=1 Tax=Pseudonocardia charpentierae TaxID=3075545 RepID=A0ABU2NMH7_9PSEU|nr:hypothetical protein [Pseudonocardia sp. DSM 45834]MDT0353844.1 hypothetical protein [Pseudonocardia sp. DSM 45834]
MPLATAVLGFFSWWLLPDIERDPRAGQASSFVGSFSSNDVPPWLAIALLTALLILAGLLYRIPVPTTAAMLLIAVTSISMGLYGATKLSVTSKAFPIDPSVTASVELINGIQVIKAGTVAARRDGKPLHVSVIGMTGTTTGASATESSIGEAETSPDVAGDVNATTVFPINTARWRTIEVRICDGENQCAKGAKSIMLSGDLPQTFPRVSGYAKPADGGAGAEVSISVDALPQDSRIRATVYRKRESGRAVVASALLVGDSKGNVIWSAPIIRVPVGGSLSLAYSVCAVESELHCESETEIASYTR